MYLPKSRIDTYIDVWRFSSLPFPPIIQFGIGSGLHLLAGVVCVGNLSFQES